MADEKLNVSPEENPQPSLFDAGPEGAPAQDAPAPEPPAPENAPEQTGGEPPVQDAPAGVPGAVNVSADQIEKLMTTLQKPLKVYMICSLYASVQGINDSPFLPHRAVHGLQVAFINHRDDCA